MAGVNAQKPIRGMDHFKSNLNLRAQYDDAPDGKVKPRARVIRKRKVVSTVLKKRMPLRKKRPVLSAKRVVVTRKAVPRVVGKPIAKVEKQIKAIEKKISGPKVNQIQKVTVPLTVIKGQTSVVDLQRVYNTALNPLLVKESSDGTSTTPLSRIAMQYGMWKILKCEVIMKHLTGSGPVIGTVCYCTVRQAQAASEMSLESILLRNHRIVNLGSNCWHKIPAKQLEGPREGWWLVDTNLEPEMAVGPALELFLYGQTMSAYTNTPFAGPLWQLVVNVTYEFSSPEIKPTLSKLSVVRAKTDGVTVTATANDERLVMHVPTVLSLQMDPSRASRVGIESISDTIVMVTDVLTDVLLADGPWAWLLKGGWWCVRKMFGYTSDNAGLDHYLVYPSVNAASQGKPAICDTTVSYSLNGEIELQQLNNPNIAGTSGGQLGSLVQAGFPLAMSGLPYDSINLVGCVFGHLNETGNSKSPVGFYANNYPTLYEVPVQQQANASWFGSWSKYPKWNPFTGQAYNTADPMDMEWDGGWHRIYPITELLDCSLMQLCSLNNTNRFITQGAPTVFYKPTDIGGVPSDTKQICGTASSIMAELKKILPLPERLVHGWEKGVLRITSGSTVNTAPARWMPMKFGNAGAYAPSPRYQALWELKWIDQDGTGRFKEWSPTIKLAQDALDGMIFYADCGHDQVMYAVLFGTTIGTAYGPNMTQHSIRLGMRPSFEMQEEKEHEKRMKRIEAALGIDYDELEETDSDLPSEDETLTESLLRFQIGDETLDMEA